VRRVALTVQENQQECHLHERTETQASEYLEYSFVLTWFTRVTEVFSQNVCFNCYIMLPFKQYWCEFCCICCILTSHAGAMRITVISTSVCVCPQGYLRNHKCNLYQFFVDVAHDHGSILLQQGNKIPRGPEGAILGFSSPLTMHCTASHLGTIQTWLNWLRHRLGRGVGLAPETVCYVVVMIPKGEGAIFGKTSVRQA